MIQLFTEVRRHKPSVIYIPNVDTWYRTVGEAVISVFRGLIRSLAPTEPVLLLGILESENRNVDPQMIKDLFGFSKRNQFEIDRPSKVMPARDAPRLDPKSLTSLRSRRGMNIFLLL